MFARLLNDSIPARPQLMEVEVVHSRHFLFSAIQMYMDVDGKRTLVAVAHTVDLNTVPSLAALNVKDAARLVSPRHNSKRPFLGWLNANIVSCLIIARHQSCKYCTTLR